MGIKDLEWNCGIRRLDAVETVCWVQVGFIEDFAESLTGVVLVLGDWEMKKQREDG